MTKLLPVIALALSAIALGLAGISHHKLPAASRPDAPGSPALADRLRMLERKYTELKKAHEELVSQTHGGNSPGDPLVELAPGREDTASRQALERIARNIDKLGLIKAMEANVREARATLLDESLPDWNRIRAVDKLKALGQFDDEAVAAVRKLWTDSGDFNAKGGALKALGNHVDVGMRDEILFTLQQELDEGNPAPRFRAAAVEALAPMMPDPDIELWVEHIATNDPEPRVQMFASKFLPPDADTPPAPRDTPPANR